MTESERLADVIALVVHGEVDPLRRQVAALETRPPARDGAPGRDGEKGLVGPAGPPGAPGRDGEKGLVGPAGPPGAPGRDGEKGLVGPAGPPGAPGRDGEKGLDGKSGVDGKDGRSVTVEEIVPVILGEVTKQMAAMPAPKDGVGLTGALITQDGHLALTLSDGTTKDVGAVIGPPGTAGEKGADGVEPVAGLSPEIITASVDMLMRKELAALDAAAPPRMMKRIIRDARGKIERVIEEPARG